MVQIQIQLQDIDPGLAEEAELARFDMFGDKLLHLIQFHAACLRDAGSLGFGGSGADVRIEAAGGSGDQIGRNRAVIVRIIFAELVDGSLTRSISF